MRVTAATESASETIGRLFPGVRICGVTKGQFSLLDLIRAVLENTGPAHVEFSTWTTGIRDAQAAAWLLKRGDFLSVKILTDRSFPIRQALYCKKLIEMFGDDAIFCSKVHCKVALIYNDNWSIVIRSSMNLNRNPRFEQFDLDDDPELLAWWREIFADIRKDLKPGIPFGNEQVLEAFQKALVTAETQPKKQDSSNSWELQSDFDLDSFLDGMNFE